MEMYFIFVNTVDVDRDQITVCDKLMQKTIKKHR